MSTSTISPRLAAVLAAELSGHDHDGYGSGQLAFGPDGRLALSVVCGHCGVTVAVLGSLDCQLKAKLEPALDLAA
jgi:hypothetical protein